jgi:manganese-dependent inorganic pyrophosphatase
MDDIRGNRGYDLIMLMLTDIIKESSEVLFSGSRDVISQAFNIKAGKNSVYLNGVVSRKKQVVPPVAMILNK